MRDAGWAADLADEREAQAREACPARPRVVVIGDAFVDEYVYADRVRLNPEAPTLCATIDNGARDIRPGGASNVAANLAAMLRGVAEVREVYSRTRPTKMRIVADDRVVFRLDVGDKCDEADIDVNHLRGAAAIVVADYGKGSVTDAVWRTVAKVGVPVFAHTKDGPHEQFDPRACRTVTWFVNRAEHDKHADDYEAATCVVVTDGERGAVRMTPNRAVRCDAFPATVRDVCGAGDSFMAAYVAAWIRNPDETPERLLRAGCAAGAAAVERFGTTVVDWDAVQQRVTFQPFGLGFATREEYDAQDGVDWGEVFDEVLL